MTITGTTRLYAILADPIGHVRAPALFNPLFAARGIDAVMVPLHATTANLPAVWAGLRSLGNLDGVLVTVPHKQTAAALCDRLTEEATLTGAINVARRDAGGGFHGGMFDGSGFVAGLIADGIDPGGRQTLLLGAGGAAAAIAFTLVRAGIAALRISNRDQARAEALAARLRAAAPCPVDCGPPDPRGCDLVVNATALGLHATDPLPLDPMLLDHTMIVADIIMEPAETALLRAASERGCRIHYGHHMLDGQFALLCAFLGLA